MVVTHPQVDLCPKTWSTNKFFRHIAMGHHAKIHDRGRQHPPCFCEHIKRAELAVTKKKRVSPYLDFVSDGTFWQILVGFLWHCPKSFEYGVTSNYFLSCFPVFAFVLSVSGEIEFIHLPNNSCWSLTLRCSCLCRSHPPT